MNKTFSGDCISLLKGIEPRSIDLLLTDPPYGMNFQSNYRKTKYNKIENDISLSWLVGWLVEIERVLKPDAHSYIFCSHHNIDIFLTAIKKYLPYKNLLIWEKNNTGMGDLKGDFAPQYELIIFCSNGKKKLNGRRDSNILKFKRTGNKLHPTEKPVDLLEFLIKKSTKETEIVLDTFAGSFSTGTACINTNRKYTLMELDCMYYAKGVERLKENV